MRWLTATFLLVSGVGLSCGDANDVGAFLSPDGGGLAADASGETAASPDAREVTASDTTAGADGQDTAEATGTDGIGTECPLDRCLVAGACVADGAPNPANACEVCRVLADRHAFTFNDAATCDDQNACTSGDHCDAGQCVASATTKCTDDANPCSLESCDPVTGQCGSTPQPGPCATGDACLTGATCQDGVCAGGTQVTCDDGKPCTVDACDKATGCAHTATTAACNDGNPCTEGDSCATGSCAGVAMNCDDQDVCTVDYCVAGTGCTHASLAAKCNDGNPCTAESCDAQDGCVYPPTAGTCDDGNLCTTGDLCKNGACVGVAVPTDDSDPCTDDACVPASGVVHLPNTAPCEDGNACTLGDTCTATGCAPGTGTLSCDDENQCTENTCDPNAACVYVPRTGTCDDATVCTKDDACLGGACIGDVINCDDGNACTADTCHPQTGCAHALIASHACRPEITVTYPPRGATLALTLTGGTTAVDVKGTVKSGAGPITTFTLNGNAVAVAADGSFTTTTPAHVGGNTLVFLAQDAMGSKRDRVQSFLLSSTYLLPDDTKPKSGMVTPGLGIWLSQKVLDDKNHSLPPNDFATVFELVIGAIDLNGMIPNPVYDGSTHSVSLSNLTHGAPVVGLASINGGLGLTVTMANVKGDLAAKGKKIACLPVVGCTYYPSANGTLTMSKITITADVALSVDGSHALKAKLKNVKVTIDGAKINIDSALSFIIDPILNLVLGAIKGQLETQFATSIASSLEPTIEKALTSLAINTTLAIPPLAPGGTATSVALVTDFDTVDFTPKGGAIFLRAGAYAAKKTPHVNLGVPTRVGCGEKPQTLVMPKSHDLELVLADDTFNELLFGAWRGGFLEFDLPAETLAGVDLAKYGVSNMTVHVSGMLAPTMADCGTGGVLLLKMGDLGVKANLTLFGQPAHVQMYVSLAVEMTITATNGQLGFQVTGIKSLDAEARIEEGALVDSESAFTALFAEQLVPKLLGALTQGSLGAFPLPKIDLSGVAPGVPPGTGITIVPSEVVRDSGNTIVGGGLQ